MSFNKKDFLDIIEEISTIDDNSIDIDTESQKKIINPCSYPVQINENEVIGNSKKSIPYIKIFKILVLVSLIIMSIYYLYLMFFKSSLNKQDDDDDDDDSSDDDIESLNKDIVTDSYLKDDSKKIDAFKNMFQKLQEQQTSNKIKKNEIHPYNLDDESSDDDDDEKKTKIYSMGDSIVDIESVALSYNNDIISISDDNDDKIHNDVNLEFNDNDSFKKENITNDEPVDDVITNDEHVDDVITNDEPVDDVITNDEPVDDVITNDEPVDDVITNDEPVDENKSIFYYDNLLKNDDSINKEDDTPDLNILHILKDESKKKRGRPPKNLNT